MKNNIIAIKGGIYSGKDTVFQMINEIVWDYYKERFAAAAELHYPQYTNEKFAGKLKDIVCLLVGCTREQLEDRNFKEAPLGEEWRVHWATYLVSTVSTIKVGHLCTTEEELDDLIAEAVSTSGLSEGYVRKHSELLTPRKILQLLGTEAGRQIIHPQIWVNSLFADLTPESKWIITDCRFPNEADAVRERGGMVIDLQRHMPFPNWCEVFEVRHPASAYLSGTFPMHAQEFAHLVKEEYPELFSKLTHASETALNHYTDFDYVIDNSSTLESLREQIKEILVSEGIIKIKQTS